MTVKELIEKLQTFNPEFEVKDCETEGNIDVKVGRFNEGDEEEPLKVLIIL